MILGAYWSPRREPEMAAAQSVAGFLGDIARIDRQLAHWFPLGKVRKADPSSQLPSLDVEVVLQHMRRIRTDTDRRVIESLGWQLLLWNGSGIGVSVTVGLYAQNQVNSVVLEFGPRDKMPGIPKQKAILWAMIRRFDPEHAVATSDEVLEAANAEVPWEAGWIQYQRGGDLRVSESAP